METNTYMEDCIHLKACRRMAVIAENGYDTTITERGCNHRCNAYEQKPAFEDPTLQQQIDRIWRVIELHEEGLVNHKQRIEELKYAICNLKDSIKEAENGRKTNDSEDDNTL